MVFRPITRFLAVLAVALLLVGCASAPTAGWRSEPHDAGPLDLPDQARVTCPPLAAADGDAALALVLPGRVSPAHAPLPAGEAERHLFASLYEPLLRVDCTGRPQPALARRWEAFAGGRVWVFHLRRGARFWNDAPVDAAAVLRSWRRSEALCRLRGEPSPFIMFDPRGESAVALDPHTLRIRLHQASDRFPLQLAHLALAVVGEPDGRGWLAGSGPCRPVADFTAAGLTLAPRSGHPHAPAWSQLEIRLLDAARDARDALDAGAHAVVTRDRDVRDYYAALRRVEVLDLPWDRWYYLVTPPGDEEARRRWTAGWQRLELAREIGDYVAEPADFGPHEPDQLLCPGLEAHVPERVPPALPEVAERPSHDDDLVLWPADDPDAGQLAGRLASLAARPLRPGRPGAGRGPLDPPREPGPGTRPASLAVPPDDLLAHLQAARVGAVVLPWPRRFPTACAETVRLLSVASWLQEAAFAAGTDAGAVPPGARPANFREAARPTGALAAMRRLERSTTVQPLVRSRAVLVSRSDVRGWSWNLDGTLRLWTMAGSD